MYRTCSERLHVKREYEQFCPSQQYVSVKRCVIKVTFYPRLLYGTANTRRRPVSRGGAAGSIVFKCQKPGSSDCFMYSLEARARCSHAHAVATPTQQEAGLTSGRRPVDKAEAGRGSWFIALSRSNAMQLPVFYFVKTLYISWKKQTRIEKHKNMTRIKTTTKRMNMEFWRPIWQSNIRKM